MPRLIWVVAGHTCLFVGFVMRLLKLDTWNRVDLKCTEMCPKDAEGMENSINPDQNAPTSLIWVYSVCTDLSDYFKSLWYTVMVLNFQTDRSGQTVQTLIRLLLEVQSDRGLHCLQCCLHPLDAILYGKAPPPIILSILRFGPPVLKNFLRQCRCILKRSRTHWSMFTSDCRWQRRLAVRYNVEFLEQNGCTH